MYAKEILDFFSDEKNPQKLDELRTHRNELTKEHLVTKSPLILRRIKSLDALISSYNEEGDYETQPLKESKTSLLESYIDDLLFLQQRLDFQYFSNEPSESELKNLEIRIQCLKDKIITYRA